MTNQSKPRLKTALWVVAAVVVTCMMTTLFCVFSSGSIKDESYLILKSTSEDGHHNIAVVADDLPTFTFGSQPISIRVDNSTDTLSTHIANDGAMLKESDCSIVWNGLTAIITISGAEQKDAVFMVSFGKDKRYSIIW